MVTIAVPTLRAGAPLEACLSSLRAQTHAALEIVVIDNSGRGLCRATSMTAPGLRIIEMDRNAGFAAAMNVAIQSGTAPFFAALNDDTIAHPEWLSALVREMTMHPQVGMCASQVRLYGRDALDSAGMLICLDGSSVQRGHLERPELFRTSCEVLLPSASAALYRRAMLDQVGGFDERFFMYCEDTDLGLRARRAGWSCAYVPAAVVEHHYSQTAGSASRLKAYYVERNRLRVAVKNFPGRLLLWAPFITLSRYLWHCIALLRRRGSAGRFRTEENGTLALPLIVLKSHFSLLFEWRDLWTKRRSIRRTAKMPADEFTRLLRAHSVSARTLASH